MQDLALANIIISACGVILIAVNYQRLRRLAGYRLFIGSYLVLCLGWIASLCDEGMQGQWINWIEHGFYFLSLALLGLWLPALRRGQAVNRRS